MTIEHGKFIQQLKDQAPVELLSAEVPEWGTDESGQDYILYFMPFTIGDLKKIERHSGGDPFETLIYTLIFKALDAQGENLFTLADKKDLTKNIASHAITAAVTRMNKVDQKKA